MLDWLWPAIIGFLAGAAAALGVIEKGRVLVGDIYRTWWLRRHPWKIVVNLSWLTSGQIAQHANPQNGDVLEKPFALRNRGARDVAAVRVLLRDQPGGSMDAYLDVVDPNGEQVPLPLPAGPGRWSGVVRWADADGIHTQRVKAPSWDVSGYK